MNGRVRIFMTVVIVVRLERIVVLGVLWREFFRNRLGRRIIINIEKVLNMKELF